MEQNAITQIETELFGAAQPVLAHFTISASYDQTESERLGRPIFRDVITICEIVKGQRDYASRPVTEADKKAYPLEWRRFAEAVAAKPYRLEAIPGATPSQIEMLKARGVRTLQQAASIESPDPEIADPVLKARRWLALESGEKPRIRLESAA